MLSGVDDNPAAPHPPPVGQVDTGRLDDIRASLDAARAKPAADALPDLRRAAELLAAAIDETMAAAVLAGQASLRSAGQRAGLSENAVGPRLAHTRALGAYADPSGRVTAAGVERARYDHESGTPRTTPRTTTPMRFRPRRPTS
jgi:hypothetical protein